jgi:NAD(P)-dependent dehydrogenase (short-subunit alcohol dehydrogenase family)
MIRQTPLRKLATPEDVAAAISFLASPAAGHITGQVLSVSGGLTMV